MLSVILCVFYAARCEILLLSRALLLSYPSRVKYM